MILSNLKKQKKYSLKMKNIFYSGNSYNLSVSMKNLIISAVSENTLDYKMFYS